jgi:hypothetical protein
MNATQGPCACTIQQAPDCGRACAGQCPDRMVSVFVETGERAVFAATTRVTPPQGANPWRDAVIDQLVICHLYAPVHDSDPRKALGDLLAWNQSLALDPDVSAEAQALIDRGYADAISTVADKLDVPGLREGTAFAAMVRKLATKD